MIDVKLLCDTHNAKRKIGVEKTFTGQGVFDALTAASRWRRAEGLSIGASAGGLPCGLKRGDYNIEKWYHLAPADRAALDGEMFAEDFRNGPVTVILFARDG